MAVSEETILATSCPKCTAPSGSKCLDLRVTFDGPYTVKRKNPGAFIEKFHDERIRAAKFDAKIESGYDGIPVPVFVATLDPFPKI